MIATPNLARFLEGITRDRVLRDDQLSIRTQFDWSKVKGPTSREAGKARKRQRQVTQFLATLETDPVKAAQTALDHLESDEKEPVYNQMMAMALERLGYLSKALEFLERCLKLTPNNPDIHTNLGIIAAKLEMLDASETFYRLALQLDPKREDAIINLSSVLREKGDFDAAIEILRTAIMANPTAEKLWNALGTVLLDAVRPEEALTFYLESARLNPAFGRAFHNMGLCHNLKGDPQSSIEAFEKALACTMSDEDEPSVRHALGMSRLAVGDLVAGWADYRARHDPRAPKNDLVILPRPYWNVMDDLPAGSHLLIVAEQGIGDEILFSSLLPDLIAEFGSQVTMSLAVERRLVGLFARSFEGVHVGAHHSVLQEGRKKRTVLWLDELESPISHFVNLGDLGERYRRTRSAFPRQTVLVPDSERVEGFRVDLARLGARPKIGLCWKSMVMNVGRSIHFSPLEQWKKVIRATDADFILLQYGDVDAEIAEIARDTGVTIWQHPTLNLKDDLDGVLALSAALDIAIGPMNASTNLAAAAGTPVWVINLKQAWTQCGTNEIPFYADTRSFNPDRAGAWEPVMDRFARELAEFSRHFSTAV
jgi:tetratricopeptide (TPR) repeat protein